MRVTCSLHNVPKNKAQNQAALTLLRRAPVLPRPGAASRVHISKVLGSRARWFESVPERSNANDPAPLKVKELWVKKRRYIVCLNEEERCKDAHDREAIVSHLKQQLRSGDKSAKSHTRSEFR